MLPKSIRWRLPLSYAAIALLAALALGLVLVLTLRNYYQRLELNYLNSNAREIGVVMGDVLQSAQDKEQPLNPQAKAKALSFLSQARIRVLDAQRQLLLDSGPVQPRNVLAVAGIPARPEQPKPPEPPVVLYPPSSPNRERLPMPARPLGNSEAFSMSLTKDATFTSPTAGALITGGAPGDYLISFLVADEAIALNPGMNVDHTMWLKGIKMSGTMTDSTVMYASQSLYGFDLDPNATFEARRSDQVVQQPFFGSQGNLLGYVELSEGPAYGRDIVEDVARGWAIASTVAVLLAAGVGFVISRRISSPLVVLTDVTTRMAEGDLSARANITRQDELGALAASFNEMADRVEGTVDTLRHFVSDAAHELNTPLTALKTNLELAAQTANGDGERAAYLERSHEQITRLETLTKSLLDLSRLEAGAANAEMSDTDMVKLAKEISELYASRAEQAGIHFTLDLPNDPIIVRGNTTFLQRAIGNLLDNAIKFTPRGGSVKLGMHRLGDRAEVTVEDSGIGIPAEDLSQLFARFHRARNAVGYPGNGLGLAIVKAIVESHGGEVSAGNTGTGSRFKFWLPGAHRK